MINRLVQLFKEPSTYAGIAAIALAFGISEAQWATVSTVGAALAGIVAMLLPEQA